MYYLVTLSVLNHIFIYSPKYFLQARSNTCPVPNRSPHTPITPPPIPTQKFIEPNFSQHQRSFFGKKDNLVAMLGHSKVSLVEILILDA